MASTSLDEKPEEALSTEERMEWLRARGVFIEEPADRQVTSSASTGGAAFQYVRIPYDESQDIEECKGQTSSGDAMPALVGPKFGGSDKISDEDLKAHAKAAGQDIEVSALRTVMAKGGAESFRLAVPTEGNGREGVYAYLDEASALKGLPKNDRATKLAEQCGFPATCVLSGDIYIGRQKWDTSGILENVSFLIQELDPKAQWIRRAPTENLEFQKSTQPDAHETAQASGANGGLASGETESYTWRDEGESVEVEVKVEQGVTKKDIKIDFKRQELRVLKPVELTLKLFRPIDTDGCNWTLGKGMVCVTMEKAKPEAWSQLLA